MRYLEENERLQKNVLSFCHREKNEKLCTEKFTLRKQAIPFISIVNIYSHDSHFDTSIDLEI